MELLSILYIIMVYHILHYLKYVVSYTIQCILVFLREINNSVDAIHFLIWGIFGFQPSETYFGLLTSTTIR